METSVLKNWWLLTFNGMVAIPFGIFILVALNMKTLFEKLSAYSIDRWMFGRARKKHYIVYILLFLFFLIIGILLQKGG